MRLTQWTDYSLRVLMYCAVTQDRARAPTVSEISETHGISRSHLMKIVMTLAAQGLIETSRGRGGGIRLLKPAEDIVIGDVLRLTETDFKMVECFDGELNTCRLNGFCRLKTALQEATDAYLRTLDGVTLADLVRPPSMTGTAPLRRQKRH
jgi:Rrf2 family transcriptional regulator, nitric oxide-sensitive transcriptional repressor